MKMKNGTWMVALGLAALTAWPVQAGLFGTKTKVEDGDADMGLPEYKGLRHAVGVKNFVNEAGWRGHWELGDNLSTMLESSLFDTGRFVVVERENLGDVVAEQDLAASGRTAAATKVAQTGKIRPAKYLAGGAITEVVDDTSGGGGGIRVKGFNIGLKGKKAQVTIIAKLIDSTTGEIVNKHRIVGKPGGIGIKLGYSTSGFSGDLGGFTKTPLGEAAQDAINQAAKWFALEMEEIPFTGTVVKGADGQVIINRGEQFGVAVGQELIMRTAGEELIDPDTGEILDREEGKTIGTIVVTKVREKIAYCEVTDGEQNPARGVEVAVE